jgi:hypothetical protein
MMGQVGKYLRRAAGGYEHWCPGCGKIHLIPDSWIFGGDVNAPTFSPSVKITGVQTVNDANGEWTGEWMCDANGKALPACCHYILTEGHLNFCEDCTHAFKGQTVPLPELPPYLRDRL